MVYLQSLILVLCLVIVVHGVSWFGLICFILCCLLGDLWVFASMFSIVLLIWSLLVIIVIAGRLFMFDVSCFGLVVLYWVSALLVCVLCCCFLVILFACLGFRFC